MSTLTVPQDAAEADVQPELTEEKRKMWDYYEQEVMKAIENDKWVPYNAEFWDKIHADVEQRLQAKKATKTT